MAKGTKFIGTDDAVEESTGSSGITMPSGSFKVDLTKIKGDLFPEGEYHVQVKKAIPGLSKTEQPKINLHLKVLDGPYTDNIIFGLLSFAPEAGWALKKALVGLGFPEDYDGEVDPTTLVGVELYVTVAIEDNKATNPKTGKPYGQQNKITVWSQEATVRDLDSLLAA